MDPDKLEKSTTTSGQPPESGFASRGAPGPIDPSTGMHTSYWILTKEERSKGFVRPVRRTYIHEVCNTETQMGLAIAETYARDPKFYGATFCVECREHLPVGEHGKFVWKDDPTQKVGT